MTIPRILALVVSVVVLVAEPGRTSDAGDWTILRESGTVTINSPASAQPISATSGATIPAGAIVSTGGDGRAFLSRGGTSITINANSRLQLPAEPTFGFTNVVESKGTAEFDVDHLPNEHFSVSTPYLAAIVKGTRFRVHVGHGAASVTVIRGIVGVTNTASGRSVDVFAGQTANVATSGTGVTVSGNVNAAAANEDATAASGNSATNDNDAPDGSGGNGKGKGEGKSGAGSSGSSSGGDSGDSGSDSSGSSGGHGDGNSGKGGGNGNGNSDN